MPTPKPPRADELFPPVAADNPDPQTFELGLVLGGTVSAGAYTAGALDFLTEALEAWHAEPSPPHRVVLKVAGGSSGGAVCAAILGVLSGRVVPHVDSGNPPGEGVETGNPLWQLWVERFHFDRFVDDGDLDPPRDADSGTGARMKRVQHVPSLLNAGVIDEAGQWLGTFAGERPPARLPWFAAPFRVAVTVTNSRGIPYHVAEVPSLGKFAGAAYLQYDDFAWFAFPNGAASDAALPAGRREDEFWLDPAARGAGFAGFDTLVAFATASGAFPIVLAARALSRPVTHYAYRPLVRPVTDLPERVRVDWPVPDWRNVPDAQDGSYAFTGVDGGTLNNDPVLLVHRALAGLVGRNPRGKSDARRAMLMIDPLADEPKPIERTGKSLLAVVGGLVPTLVGGARYLTADMDLFADEDVFSRFQLVPFRKVDGVDRVGEAALAGSTFFAAAGWCARPFRAHDYLLGRSNMQEYLKKELVLAGDNPLFAKWTIDDRMDWAVDKSGARVDIDKDTPRDSYFLPVIPDKTGVLATVPNWPKGQCDTDAVRRGLARRLQAVVKQVTADNGLDLPWLIRILVLNNVVQTLVDSIVDGWESDLTKAGLR